MAPTKPLAALLCAAALVAAAGVAPAGAALLCKDETIQLQMEVDGCNSVTLAKESIVATSAPTNGSLTQITWSGAQPQVEQAGPVTSYVFLGGVTYSYNATNPTEPGCSGTVSVLPCPAVCRNLNLNVTATAPNSTCTLKIGSALFSEADLIDADSVSSAITNYSVTSLATGSLAMGGQFYPVGTWYLQTQILYPNGKSDVSKPCTVTIRDVTSYGAPMVNAAADCFYANNTGKSNYRLPLSALAALPPGPKCPRLRLVATECAPVKRNRICLPQSQPFDSTTPGPANGIDVVRRRAAGKQQLTVTMQVEDPFGLKGTNSTAKITVYKSKGLVPKADRDRCVPIGSKY